MFENKRRSDGAVDIPDRRMHARVPLRSLAYLSLDGGNGGLILNICEGGIAVQTAGIITDIFFPKMRFRLPQSETWIEAAGKLAWQGPSRKEAGIRFVALTEDTRERIKSWIDSVALDADFPSELDQSRTLPESEEPTQEPQGSFNSDPLAEFDSMFPSESSLPPATRRSKRELVPAPAAPELNGTPEAASVSPTNPRQESTDASPQPALTAAADRAEEPPPPPGGSPRTAPSVEGTSFYEEILAAQPESASLHDSGAVRLSESALAPKLESVAVAPGAREIPFTAFGYQPAAFEEPAGKEWIVVVAALAALLILGVVVSVGPAKLTALLFHRAPTPASTEAAVPGPPPPYGATDKSTPNRLRRSIRIPQPNLRRRIPGLRPARSLKRPRRTQSLPRSTRRLCADKPPIHRRHWRLPELPKVSPAKLRPLETKPTKRRKRKRRRYASSRSSIPQQSL